MTSDKSDLKAAMAEALPIIDRHLAEQDVPLGLRPLHASVEFTDSLVMEVQEAGKEPTKPGSHKEYLQSPWFAEIFSIVHAWYRERFGAAMADRDKESILGVISISGTAFAIRVPTTLTRRGQPGETAWLAFPDGVRPGEKPVEWIQDGPSLGQEETEDVEKQVVAIAELLRSIRTALLGIAAGDERLDGLKAGILPRLEHAADLLLGMRSSSVKQAYWELQLACEHALKALQQQQLGTFKQTHDLFVLYDTMATAPKFERDLLKQMPQWKESAEMRYGQGRRENRLECLKCYRSALEIVAGAAKSFERFEIGKAEFEIQQPPWMSKV